MAEDVPGFKTGVNSTNLAAKTGALNQQAREDAEAAGVDLREEATLAEWILHVFPSQDPLKGLFPSYLAEIMGFQKFSLEQIIDPRQFSENIPAEVLRSQPRGLNMPPMVTKPDIVGINMQAALAGSIGKGGQMLSATWDFEAVFKFLEAMGLGFREITTLLAPVIRAGADRMRSETLNIIKHGRRIERYGGAAMIISQLTEVEMTRRIPKNQGKYFDMKLKGLLGPPPSTTTASGIELQGIETPMREEGRSAYPQGHQRYRTLGIKIPGTRLPLGTLSGALYRGIAATPIRTHFDRSRNNCYMTWNINQPNYANLVHEGHEGAVNPETGRGKRALPRPFLDVATNYTLPDTVALMRWVIWRFFQTLSDTDYRKQRYEYASMDKSLRDLQSVDFPSGNAGLGGNENIMVLVESLGRQTATAYISGRLDELDPQEFNPKEWFERLGFPRKVVEISGQLLDKPFMDFRQMSNIEKSGDKFITYRNWDLRRRRAKADQLSKERMSKRPSKFKKPRYYEQVIGEMELEMKKAKVGMFGEDYSLLDDYASSGSSGLGGYKGRTREALMRKERRDINKTNTIRYRDEYQSAIKEREKKINEVFDKIATRSSKTNKVRIRKLKITPKRSGLYTSSRQEWRKRNPAPGWSVGYQPRRHRTRRMKRRNVYI